MTPLKFCSLPRNLEAEFPAISWCSETQTQLGCSQWSEAHQQVHLWMAQNKMKKQTNEGFWVKWASNTFFHHHKLN